MGGGTPQDNSAQVAQIEAQAARENQIRMDKEAAKKQSDFDKRINSAFGTGVSGAEDYFASQGLDPGMYRGKIKQKAGDIRGGIPNLDANPGSYFANLGEMIYNSEQSAERNRDLRGIDSYAPAGFATDRISDTSDDSILNAILGEQEAGGTEYIQNLLDRGVITSGGFAAANKNLQGQKPGALSKLNTIGMGEIERGRGGAENMANKARTTASNQKLGDIFDPYKVGTDLTNYFGKFFTDLDPNIRGKAPTNLFDTGGLATIAGAAQGAGNTAFDPNAVAGIFNDDDEDEEELSSIPF